MAKYRQKPLFVEAVRFDPQAQPWPDGVIPWSRAGYQPRDMSFGYIDTSLGKVHVMAGDWIITTALTGARFTCKPDDFELTYERVTD